MVLNINKTWSVKLIGQTSVDIYEKSFFGSFVTFREPMGFDAWTPQARCKPGSRSVHFSSSAGGRQEFKESVIR